MSKLLAALGLSTALMASAALPLAGGAQAAMAYGGLGADAQLRQVAPIEKAQFFWGGNNYCWYDDGWSGPGWYWCGYAWNRGFGWGGGYGWHHWSRGGPGWGPGGPHPGPGPGPHPGPHPGPGPSPHPGPHPGPHWHP
jgi:hypothetical protein